MKWDSARHNKHCETLSTATEAIRKDAGARHAVYSGVEWIGGCFLYSMLVALAGTTSTEEWNKAIAYAQESHERTMKAVRTV